MSLFIGRDAFGYCWWRVADDGRHDFCTVCPSRRWLEAWRSCWLTRVTSRRISASTSTCQSRSSARWSRWTCGRTARTCRWPTTTGRSTSGSTSTGSSTRPSTNRSAPSTSASTRSAPPTPCWWVRQTVGGSRLAETLDTWAEKFESFERINSIRETNGSFDSCNSCKRLGTSRLHKSKTFVCLLYRIYPFETFEFFCSCIRPVRDYDDFRMFQI